MYYHDREEETNGEYNTETTVAEGSEITSGDLTGPPETATSAFTKHRRTKQDYGDCPTRSEENMKLSIIEFTKRVAWAIVTSPKPDKNDPIHAELVYRLSQGTDGKSELLQCILAHGLRFNGDILNTSITNAFAKYIIDNDIIKDCGLNRIAQGVELGDWIKGEALRLLQNRGDMSEEFAYIFAKRLVQNIIGDSLQSQGDKIDRGRDPGLNQLHKNGTRTIATMLTEQIVRTIEHAQQCHVECTNDKRIAGYIQNAGHDQRIFDGGHLPTITKEATETSTNGSQKSQNTDAKTTVNTVFINTEDEQLANAYTRATRCAEQEGLESPILANLKYGWGPRQKRSVDLGTSLTFSKNYAKGMDQ